MVFILPNGKPIDTGMVEMAMEDADATHLYYLNTETHRKIAMHRAVQVLHQLWSLSLYI